MRKRHWAQWFIICLAGSVLLGGIASGSGFARPTAAAANQTPLPIPVPLPGAGSRTYPATGQTVSGVFLDYWDAHGGLAQQGYPIAPVMGEVSDLDGQPYTIQYFERAVFEYHPENAGGAYQVLLSQLGTFQYHQKYPNGAPDQRPNTTRDSVYFAQTGHRLGGSFLAYWQQHGELAQQGYPLSDEFTEVSDLDGKPYTVQYFERAVFEYHPENGAPYDVLLSQLGTFQYNAKYRPAVPSPTASVTPAVTPAPSGVITQSIASGIADRPIVGGHDIFWVDTRNGYHSIYGYDLDKGQEFVVSNLPGAKGPLASDGNMVAWVETVAGAPPLIRAYDIQSGHLLPPVQAASITSEFGGIAIAGGVLYYQDATAGHIGLYARTLATGHDEIVSPHGQNPVVEDGILLWSEQVPNGPTNPPFSYPTTCSLHMRQLSGNTGDVVVASVDGPNPGACDFDGYHASGDHITWAPYPPVSDYTHLYSISTRKTVIITAGRAINPLIHGTVAVWTVGPEGGPNGWSIQAYQLATGATKILLPKTDPQVEAWAMIDPLTVVYTQGSNLYLARFTLP